jgi:hypothetical protein
LFVAAWPSTTALSLAVDRRRLELAGSWCVDEREADDDRRLGQLVTSIVDSC